MARLPYCENKVRVFESGLVIWDHRASLSQLGPYEINPGGYVRYINQHRQTHRTNGPAIIWGLGDKEYWVCGQKLPRVEFFLKYGV